MTAGCSYLGGFDGDDKLFDRREGKIVKIVEKIDKGNYSILRAKIISRDK